MDKYLLKKNNIKTNLSIITQTINTDLEVCESKEMKQATLVSLLCESGEKHSFSPSLEEKHNLSQSIVENSNNSLENQYINLLSLKELKAYNIAKEQLKTSFTLSKAQGYKIWKNNNKSI